MSVDGTDFRILQKGAAVKGNAYGSHKYAGKSALRYELGICIRTGHLVWIEGPYAAGQWNDIAIFNNCLATFLDPNERVEADNGYRGHEDKIKCPKNASNHPDNLAMQARVRSRHETFNGRLKNWGILQQVFRVPSRHCSSWYSVTSVCRIDSAHGEEWRAIVCCRI